MTAFLPDTSCMVAAMCSWHEHHDKAARELQKRLGGKEQMIVAAPSLVEAYAVLTRLLAPHRLSPTNALTLLKANFFSDGKIATLNAADYRRLLSGSPEAGVSGGRVYDAVIAACARKAKARVLLTFNESDFASLGGPDLEIVIPH